MFALFAFSAQAEERRGSPVVQLGASPPARAMVINRPEAYRLAKLCREGEMTEAEVRAAWPFANDCQIVMTLAAQGAKVTRAAFPEWPPNKVYVRGTDGNVLLDSAGNPSGLQREKGQKGKGKEGKGAAEMALGEKGKEGKGAAEMALGEKGSSMAKGSDGNGEQGKGKKANGKKGKGNGERSSPF